MERCSGSDASLATAIRCAPHGKKEKDDVQDPEYYQKPTVHDPTFCKLQDGPLLASLRWGACFDLARTSTR